MRLDNKQILIPNGSLSNGSLINYSAKSTRRVDLIFSVGYENDIHHVKDILTKIVENHKLIQLMCTISPKIRIAKILFLYVL